MKSISLESFNLPKHDMEQGPVLGLSGGRKRARPNSQPLDDYTVSVVVRKFEAPKSGERTVPLSVEV